MYFELFHYFKLTTIHIVLWEDFIEILANISCATYAHVVFTLVFTFRNIKIRICEIILWFK